MTKRKVILIVIVILIFTLIAGCQNKEWTLYNHQEGNFSVLIPTDPEKIDVPGGSGVDFTSLYVVEDKKKDTTYIV